MRDCEWLTRQVAVEDVRRRFERRSARRERLARLLRIGHRPSRPAAALVDARRG